MANGDPRDGFFYLIGLSYNLMFISGWFHEGIILHFCASMISGLVTTAASMPVDIAKTR